MSGIDKRMTYVNGDVSSSEEGTCEETDYNPRDEVRTNKQLGNNQYTCNLHFQNAVNSKFSQSKRKPCFSKNALMARENRLRKKKYVSKLENDITYLKRNNKKLSLIVDNQSSLISELKKEIKYLKSVIINSGDISKLIRNIHQSSGMSVSSSLDENLSLKTCYVPKPKQLVSRKTAHPWEQLDTPNESLLFPSNLIDNVSDDPELFKDLDLSLNLPNQDVLDGLYLEQQLDETSFNNDHNYTLVDEANNKMEDVGVCLHISKHHVSLEFCPSCSEKAFQTWVG